MYDGQVIGAGRRPGDTIHMEVVIRTLFAAFLIPMWLVACREPSLPDLPPGDIVSASAERMNSMPGFYFTIDRTGGPAYVDPDETIVFRRAEGYYLAPDRAQATVRVIAPGLVTNVGVISIGQTQWETNILTGAWTELPPNWGFNPAVLFDPTIGIQSILVADLVDLVLEDTEKLDDGQDQQLYVVSGQMSGERIHEMSYRLIGPEEMTVRLWIAPETFELHRVLVTDPNTIGDVDEPTVWQVDFREFDKTVEIQPPALEGE